MNLDLAPQNRRAPQAVSLTAERDRPLAHL